MATITLDYLSRIAVRNLLDSTPGQNADLVRRVVCVRRALDLKGLTAALENLDPKLRTDDALTGAGTEDFEIERGDLEWLRDKVQGKDWSKHTGQGGAEVVIPMASSFLEGVLNLTDAIAEALAAKA